MSQGLLMKGIVTGIVWLSATGMLAICIPLAAAVGGGLVLPLAVIAAASGSTFIVWKSQDGGWPLPRAKQTITQLEERIQNLEAIAGRDK